MTEASRARAVKEHEAQKQAIEVKKVVRRNKL